MVYLPRYEEIVMKDKVNMEEDAGSQNVKEDIAPNYYVAIGASAGGLEAIETFFTHMPVNSNLTFIVIQHLSPDYKSLMVELLSKKTKIPVHRIENNMLALPNHIYLIPPKSNLTIFHGKLILSEQVHSKVINLPIDIFMRSLAEDQGDKAIGIILSGTGSDGMRGVRAIKEFGGMVMVQEENSAKFNGMPRSAISTGLADFILPPEEMPSQLVSYVKHPYMSKGERSTTLLTDEDNLTRIYAVLREHSKIDFTFYKPTTVIRRIERRMSVNHIDELSDYVVYLQSYPTEANALFRELLIGVTRFFRDGEAFDALRDHVLPEVLKNHESEPIRFWVAGCSTGEEAYSLAILTQEYLKKNNLRINVKIFATDVDRDALHYAAAGIYPESITADIDPNLLTKYFQKKDESFQIIRQIREMVVFAQHNLVKDPPFTNISLVSCRNLLIYLQPILQRKILEFFNFSLSLDGYLLLGTSETTGDMADYFDALDTHLKIYQSKGRSKHVNSPHLEMLKSTDTRSRDIKDRMIGVRKAIRTGENDNIFERYLHIISDHYIPLAVIVNEQMEVLHIMGDTEGYLKLPSGRLVYDISKMADKNLSIPLTTGISKAFRQRQDVRFSNIVLPKANEQRNIQVHIIPLPEKKDQNPLVAVLFNEMKKNEKTDVEKGSFSYDLSKETEEHFRELEHELQFTRENLQATIEELETSNEELQATNEELLASNEELQSTNEELQSTNEELFTVNAEYQNKIIELTELYNDIDNLMATSQIGQLLLDENLEVRRFSSGITKIFKILEGDVGRPITHISHSLVNVDFLDVIKQVQQTGQSLELEVRTQNNIWHIMKVVPYLVGPGIASGLVITFDNINRIKETHAALQMSNQKFKILFDTLSHGVVYQAANGKITAANPAAEKILGLTIDQMKGKTSLDPCWQAVHEDLTPFPGEEHPAMVALRTGNIVNNVVMGIKKPDHHEITWVNVNAVPQFKPGETEPFEVHTSFDDITKLKQTLSDLQESEDHYRQLFEEMPNAFALHEIICNEAGLPVDYRFLKVNRTFERMTGLFAKDIVNKSILTVMPDIEPVWIERYGHVTLTGESLVIKDYNKTLDKWFDVRAFRYKPGQFATIFDEIPKPELSL
jgi:two-component system CheB/CheR fusion protein